MIESVTTLTASLNSAAPSNAAALSSDVERFREALLSAPLSGTQAASTPASQAAAQAQGMEANQSAVASSKTLGDAILNTLQTASTQMQQSWQQAAEVVAGKEINMADMLQLQMTVVQTSIQYELLGKGISKSTQNLDQILKTQ